MDRARLPGGIGCVGWGPTHGCSLARPCPPWAPDIRPQALVPLTPYGIPAGQRTVCEHTVRESDGPGVVRNPLSQWTIHQETSGLFTTGDHLQPARSRVCGRRHPGRRGGRVLGERRSRDPRGLPRDAPARRGERGALSPVPPLRPPGQRLGEGEVIEGRWLELLSWPAAPVTTHPFPLKHSVKPMPSPLVLPVSGIVTR